MYSFDKNKLVSTVGPMGTRYSLSPLMTEQNKVTRYAEDRAHHEVVVKRELEVKLMLARQAKLVGGKYTSGVQRRPRATQPTSQAVRVLGN